MYTVSAVLMVYGKLTPRMSVKVNQAPLTRITHMNLV